MVINSVVAIMLSVNSVGNAPTAIADAMWDFCDANNRPATSDYGDCSRVIDELYLLDVREWAKQSKSHKWIWEGMRDGN